MKMKSTIAFADTVEVEGKDLEEGMITVQGVITDVSRETSDTVRGGNVWFEAGGQSVFLEHGHKALILGKCNAPLTEAITKAVYGA
jgi:hypothetical protein